MGLAIMPDNYKTTFLSIVALSVVWLVILLSNLPDYSDPGRGWPSWSSSNLPTQSGQHQALQYSRNNQDQIQISPSTNSNLNIRQPIYKQFQPPEQPGFMKFLLGPPKKLSKLETLFYQFNHSPYSLDHHNTLPITKLEPISLKEHSIATANLALITGIQEKFIKNEGYHLFAFNMVVSNRIGLIRPIPDTRNKKCHNTNTIKAEHGISNDQQSQLTMGKNELKSSEFTGRSSKLGVEASIIICYYNEAPSALLRTIYTVIERSPRHLINEIILVDDFSEESYDIRHIIESNLVNFPIRMLRTNKREGLIRARLLGSRSAQGDILVFLDSHVEANVGWLEPLMEIVHQNRTTIACPIIDLINADTLVYSASPMVVGGLSWNLNFKWDSVAPEKLRTYDDFIKPIDSPTMAGGLFAIDRGYFSEIGEYDEQMELWGGENIELSLRTWLCGGRIVVVPCSRVGHIFRKRRPYGPAPGKPDSLLVNSQRTARVWLDGYIENYYEANPNAQYLVGSSVEARRQLRQTLGCQNFTWFLDNVYPQLKKSLSSATIEGKGDAIGGDVNDDDDNDGNDGDDVTQVKTRSVSNPPIAKPRRVDRDTNSVSGSEVHRAIDNSVGALDSSDGHLFIRDSPSHLPKILSWFQMKVVPESNLCIGSRGKMSSRELYRLILVDCEPLTRNDHGEIVLASNSSLANQLWAETENHQLRLGGHRCLDLMKNMPLLASCHPLASFQQWLRRRPYVKHDLSGSASVSYKASNIGIQDESTHQVDANLLENLDNGLCLGVERAHRGEPLIVTVCEDSPRSSAPMRGLAIPSGHLGTGIGRWQTAPLSALSPAEIRIRTRGGLTPRQRWSILPFDGQLTRVAV